MKRSSCAVIIVVMLFGVVFAGVAAAQQYPMVDMIANNVIEKYQMTNCEQLWEQKGKPKTAQEQEAITMLRNDPTVRQYFINKVAGPIMNKMFECGMIP
ncbi:MAG TPA: hypothetical protein VMT71_13710 [Syntrophorhabdales bacterium]|nr:hypothetical protein [Syntrophorhabdales bacterium]